MTTAAIREKLQDYIRFADDKKVKAIYTILENEITSEYKWYEDEAYVKELDQDVKDYESGKTKGYTWEEVKESLRKRRLERNKKNAI